MPMILPTLSDIEEARNLIQRYTHATPILQSSTLDKLLGSTNFLKAEIFQKTGSFKPRGALNKILHLSAAEKARGVIAVSLGNHAQAVAWAANTLGLSATIVMPTCANKLKVAATRDYGAQVILYGASSVEAFAEFEKIQAERQLTPIHPFNDFHVIAGAGTLALELMEQVEDIDNIFVPVGGGGLISGIAVLIKTLSPGTKVIGTEPEGANVLARSLLEKKACKLPSVSTMADALAVPYTGEINYAIAHQYVDDIVCINDDEIKAAMKFLFERCKLVVEPGGAIGLAGLLSGKFKSAGSRNVIILSGGNVDMPLLATL